MGGSLRIVGIFNLPHLAGPGPPVLNHRGWRGHGTTRGFSGVERPAPGAWTEGPALWAAWPRAPPSTRPSRLCTDPTSGLPSALPSAFTA